jgi:hypothetical protein
MKNIIFVLIMLFAFSCNNDIIEPNEYNKKEISESFMKTEGAEEIDFFHDFVVRKVSENVPPRARPSSLEINYTRIASSNDLNYLSSNYAKIKAQLQEWSDTNENGKYSWSIQYISLRYLRNLFLNDTTPQALEEATFLLELLVKEQAIDIDVLADTFDKVSYLLPEDKRDVIYAYLQSLYLSERQFVADNVHNLKEAYENAQGIEKDFYLARGKILEIRSKACYYAGDILSLNNKD